MSAIGRFGWRSACWSARAVVTHPDLDDATACIISGEGAFARVSGMTRNLTLLLIVSVLVAFAGQAERAAACALGDAVAFSHRPCSVLDGEPCTPSTCSVFDHGPCIPEIDYPIGQNRRSRC